MSICIGMCMHMQVNIYTYLHLYICANNENQEKILCKTSCEHPNNVLSSISMTKILHLESHMLVNWCVHLCVGRHVQECSV